MLEQERRWTITSAYTERDTGDPDCPNYRVGATVKGPEQREPIEVIARRDVLDVLEFAVRTVTDPDLGEAEIRVRIGAVLGRALAHD